MQGRAGGLAKKSSSFPSGERIFCQNLASADNTTFFEPAKRNRHTLTFGRKKKMSEVMKQSEKYSEKDFGKRSDTSSHYRINCGKEPVAVGEIVKQCVELLKQKRYEYQ